MIYIYLMCKHLLDLTINTALSPLECPAASFVKGKSSGATGFVQTTVNNTTAVKLTQTSGTFVSWRANYNKW